MRRLSHLATACALGLLPLVSQAETNTCSPSRVMVLFDRSSSMRELIGSESKWTVATTALKDVVQAYDNQAEFGLALFPKTTWSCAAGVVNVAPELSALSDIEAAVPDSLVRNYWTPIGRTLAAVSSMSGMTDTSKRRFVILVTDGAESCPEDDYPGNSQSDGLHAIPNATIVSTVKSLKTAGITTYVVGFGKKSSGDGVDALLLNQLAEAGGTRRSNDCVESADPTNPKNCYYQADDGGQLADALSGIAQQISEEICDGKDNNCNGEIDENLERPCASVCGSGTEHCDLGKWVGCSAPLPTPEVCGDGKDNDCNGQTDETCECENGDTQACGKGACAGHQICVDHKWGGCDGPAPTNQSECDGVDHNCDGVIDSGDCDCVPGATQTCGGPDVGQCRTGTRTCDANGHWGGCVGAVGPSPEVCDGIDNNCDGIVDNPTVGSSTDDVPQGLCRADQICQSGHCVAAPPSTVKPPTNLAPNGEPSGCACRIGDASPADTLGSGILALLFGVAVLFRGRRGRK